MEEYNPVAVTSKITVSSRVSVKVKDTFYTVEYSEERTIPDGIEVNLAEERRALWDVCNAEVDSQVEEILNAN